MKKFLIPILVFLIVMLFTITIGKSKEVYSLKEKLKNQELYIEDLCIKTNYEHVDSLYMEIMYLGAQLDSMMLKYD
tara:strand:- start:419 stop:646 length:228 start_codon:yes stop_codon:yes gene_type:complete